jgi:hypothetical protein
METTLHHCCANCVHFRRGGSACTGRCAHPARRSPTEVDPYVRDGELACRRGWGVDLWEEAVCVAWAGCAAAVVELRIWGPFTGDTAPDDLPGDLLGHLLRGSR